jgi:RNA polymerase sigma-70 factor (ECF subfamily)
MFEQDLISLRPRLFSYAMSLTHHADQADDLVQQTMMKALVNKDKYEEGTNMIGWLITILRNEHYSIHRKRKPVNDTDDKLAGLLVDAPKQEVHVQFSEMERVFEQMTPEHRRSLTLVIISGFSYEEAAAIEDITVGTMKSRVSRARAILKRKLGGLVEDNITIGVKTNNDNFLYSNC